MIDLHCVPFFFFFFWGGDGKVMDGYKHDEACISHRIHHAGHEVLSCAHLASLNFQVPFGCPPALTYPLSNLLFPASSFGSGPIKSDPEKSLPPLAGRVLQHCSPVLQHGKLPMQSSEGIRPRLATPTGLMNVMQLGPARRSHIRSFVVSRGALKNDV